METKTIANNIKYGTIPYDFPLREKADIGRWSTYRKVFRGTKWEVFIKPIGKRHQNWNESINFATGKNNDLWDVPCIYEYAVSLSPTSKRYKVYVGKSKHARTRMMQYVNGLKDPTHIGPLMRKASESGLFIMRRIRYIIPTHTLNAKDIANAELMAVQLETRILGRYNFSWNAEKNGMDSLYGKKNSKITVRTVVKGYLINCHCFHLFPRVKFIPSPEFMETQNHLTAIS